jgi:hypothetical protein
MKADCPPLRARLLTKPADANSMSALINQQNYNRYC